MKRTIAAAVAGALALAWTPCGLAAPADRPFKVRGLGGAGGMFVPSVSPYDSNFMMVACDMSGSYRSLDGGRTWELIHYRQMNNNRNSAWPAYFRDRVFWNRGDELRVSHDQARTWQGVAARPWGKGIVCLTAIPGSPDVLLVGASAGIWRTEDDGMTWAKVVSGEVVEVVACGGKAYAVTVPNTLCVSSDRGKTWSRGEIDATHGEKVFAFTGGADASGTVLFASAWKTGIVRSRDGGRTWEVKVSKFADQKILKMAHTQTRIVYAAQHGAGYCKTMWRSVDGGETWTKAFRLGGADGNVSPSWVQTELKWGYYITAKGFTASASDPNLALLTTQGDFYLTRDGGETWQQQMNDILGVMPGDPGVRYRCTGLEVTSCWAYLFDPFDKNREYIAYTDIGFGRTVDNGKTWSWSGRGSPWRNTFYDVVFDPEIPGRMYAAASNRHDIPHWTHIGPNQAQVRSHRGGFVISDDHALTWRPSANGLPDLPCTSVALDPTTPRNDRTLYLTIFGEGAYKSVDGGKSWVKKSDGLGNAGNMHAYRIRRQPRSGNLYCLITACRIGARNFPIAGGVWKSTDGAEHWTDITREVALVWPTNLVVDDDDENVIYLTAATAPGKNQGGVYKTTDGGGNWKRILSETTIQQLAGGSGYEHMMSILVHPDDKNRIYAGSNTHGLFYSRDGGANWEHYAAFPFQNVQSIQVHPDDHGQLYLTTFGGGAWVGPHLPK